MLLFDSHCHLHDPRLDSVRDEVIARAVGAGVRGCMVCGTHPGDWDAVAALGSRAGFEIKNAFGVHPWYAEGLPEGWLDRLRSFLLVFPDAAVGEIGLDGIRAKSPSAMSREVLRAQLGLAAELGRPVVLHGAKVLDELFAVCRDYAGKVPAMTVHAFGGSEVQLVRWLEIGARVSMGGAVTRSARLRRLAAAIPRDRLLIETDSPDMLPEGGEPAIAGTTLNQPSNLVMVAKALGFAF